MAGKAGFYSFASEVLALKGQAPAAHHALLIEKLEQLANGDFDRLMVQMPPGSAKSTYGSVLFPAYFLARYPGSQIIATGHTASLADHFGRRVRGLVEEHGQRLGFTLDRQSRAAGRFSVAGGGEYFAAGVRGPITGRRADLIIVDDPIKSWADAESTAGRDALYDWYRAELTARLKPKGRIVLIMTRWHEDDLAGRLMRGDTAWHRLTLPALAEDSDAMGRPPGRALWPELQDETALALRRQEVGERAFAALYQQAPRPPASGVFNVKTVTVLAEPPVTVRSVRAWDLAASVAQGGRNPDYTVGLKLGSTAEGRLVVLDVIRMQGNAGQVEARLLATAKADGAGTLVALPQDPGQAGLAQVGYLTKALAGFHVVATPESGAKITRAMPAAARMDAGQIALLAGPWNEMLLAELVAFPDGPKDDQVDALSRAVNIIAMHGGAARRVQVPFFGR